MDLGINARRLVGVRTGVARYLSSLLVHWSHMRLPFEGVRVYTHRPIDDGWLKTSEVVRNEFFAPRMPAFMWENVPLRIRSRRDAVLFCPSCRIPIRYKGKVVATVFTAHSAVRSELLPWEHRFYSRLNEYAARHADMVITCSEAAKDDLIRFYQLPSEKVKVTPLAPTEIFRRISDRDLVESIKKKYFDEIVPFVLFVGTVSLHRNTPLLLQAFGAMKRRYRLPHRLLVVGRNYGGFDLKTLAEQNGISDSFVYAKFVSDGDLILLYNAAEVFVHPTLYDPTSLPVLEAMASGTPVITTAVSGLKEIAGGAAVLIDPPPTAESLCTALHKVLTDGELRSEMARKGLEQAKRYSWERTAAETMAIIESVASL